VYRKTIKPTNNDESLERNDCRCPYCHRRFQTPDELTLHIVTRHTQSGLRRGPAGTGSAK
jgi:5-methylcytosine-specific restriction endonuclease McrA